MARSGMDRLYVAPAIASGFGLNDTNMTAGYLLTE